MGNLVNLNARKKKADDSEETKLDEYFASVIEENQKVKERLQRQRAEANRQVTKGYRLKK